MSETTEAAQTTELDAVIVGAGFSGLYQLYKLRELGFRVRVVEAAPEVGGTWYWNRYPGARCDVESVDYSFSWVKELEQEWEWTEKYPAQPDILAYLKAVADRFDLRRDIDFNTTVSSAQWDESRQRWEVRTEDGKVYDAQFAIMAVGCLSVPKEIDLNGFENYTGEVLRTWNYPEDADLTGKKVCVIGTGSTGAQVIPALAGQVDELLVLQRTPNFVIPTRNRDLEPGELDEIKADYRDRRHRNRNHAAGVDRLDNPQNAYDVDAEERRATFEERWKGGGINFLGAFADLMFDQDANDAVCDYIRDKISETVTDQDTAEKLKPRNYPMGAKRPVVATDYYETYNRDNVHLEDLRTNDVDTFTATGVRMADGTTHEFDAVVVAIGFDAFTGAMNAMNVRGRDGRRLQDEWDQNGPRTYLGVGIHGYPNLINVASAGSPSVLANMVTGIEQHVEWISDLLVWLRDNNLTTIEAEHDAQEQWVQTVEDIANMTLWPNGDSNSWYRGANIEGKTQIFVPYAGGIVEYQKSLDQSAENSYKGFVTA